MIWDCEFLRFKSSPPRKTVCLGYSLQSVTRTLAYSLETLYIENIILIIVFLKAD